MESKNPFTDIVSVFENFSAEPKDVQLTNWLAACVKGGTFKDRVLQYRQTGAPEIKKNLPLITPGARCKGGRRKENIEVLTGWVCLDIDGKDNPHIKDAARIRDEIIKISNVAFSALSTGGQGVWALVKVSDPENQDAHFQALLKDFERFGIKLDSSKGRNANDARFFSYDPDARMKRSFEVYTKKVTSQPATRTSPIQSRTRSTYGEKALQQEIGVLAMARKGTRNETLFKCAASLFELVAGGELDGIETENLLFDTALRIGLTKSESQKTILSAKQTGLQNPRSATKTPSKPKLQKQSQPYPTEWDKVKSPQPGTAEHAEMEYYAAMDADPMLNEIVNVFGAEPVFN